MTRFPRPYLQGEVELTEEREHHIAECHPDLLPEHRERVAETLADPDRYVGVHDLAMPGSLRAGVNPFAEANMWSS